jgi:hypothetical protein
LPTQQFIVGQKVEINSGPFVGIVGIIRQIKNRACLAVSVELIARSIYVALEEYQIGPAEACAARSCLGLTPNNMKQHAKISEQPCRG